MNPTVACSSCGETNPGDTLHCRKCHAPLRPAVSATTPGDRFRNPFTSTGDMPTLAGGGTPPPLMQRGTLLAGGRYEILAILGQGAMGAVYKAKDRELDRWVAIKVVQPELVNSPSILKRFKQELILARQITHRNVVRIFDIGETEGMKFITMEYVDGSDLKSVIVERGSIPPNESVDIIRQICSALDAAHGEGVVHRDLKPQNIMIDHSGRVVVMDFGIAHSKELPGMTMTGALMGTPEYMSPEQAKGEKTDLRADIFAVGIIFYEMLTGKVPFKALTVVETMYKRTQERAIPPVDLDHSIPVQANRVVMKCLETNPDNRYQNAKELSHDLDAFDAEKKISGLERLRKSIGRRSKFVATFATVLAIILVGVVAGALLRGRINTTGPSSVAPHAPVTVLVADFNNATGDAVFSGTLESMCITALEEASFVNMYGRGTAQRLLARLENGATKLDEPAARKIAIREGISVIVAGSIGRDGSGYQITMRAIDAVTGRVIVTQGITAANTDLVLGSIGRLTVPIRTALGDTTPESSQLAAAETYTAGSLEAAHAYALGQESLGVGKQQDAMRFYKAAIDLDPNLGRAYAGLGVVNFNLKDLSAADTYYKKALGLVDRMSEREKYRTMGGYYVGVANNFDQGIEAFRKLTLSFPADAAAWTNLSTGYKRIGKMTEAADASRRAVEISPENLLRRYNLAANSMAAGDLNTATAEASKLLQKDSTFAYAYLPLALSAMLRGNIDQARDFYTRVEQVNHPLGPSFSKMGLADLSLYLGRFGEAVDILLPSIQMDVKQGNTGESAYKLQALAEAYAALGRSPQSAAAADRALKANDLDDGIHFLAALTFIDIGQYAKAQQLAKDLDGKLQQQTKSLAHMINASIALKQDHISDAVDGYREARKLHDSWEARFLLGQAYVRADHFAEGLAELDAAAKRSSEAADLFDANTTSLRYLPPLYYWLGRAHEGLGAKEPARNAYQRYIEIRQNADAADKTLADAKTRLSK